MIKHLIKRLQRLWDLSYAEPVELVVTEEFVENDQPFTAFPCEECKETVILFSQLEPGQVGVVECDNCKVSHSVYYPPLVISRTKELPPEAQDVWRQLSSE